MLTNVFTIERKTIDSLTMQQLHWRAQASCAMKTGNNIRNLSKYRCKMITSQISHLNL